MAFNSPESQTTNSCGPAQGRAALLAPLLLHEAKGAPLPQQLPTLLHGHSPTPLPPLHPHVPREGPCGDFQGLRWTSPGLHTYPTVLGHLTNAQISTQHLPLLSAQLHTCVPAAHWALPRCQPIGPSAQVPKGHCTGTHLAGGGSLCLGVKGGWVTASQAQDTWALT